MKQEYFRVGVFTSTHGIKGEIKVFPTTEDINRFDKLEHIILDTKKGRIEAEIEGLKYFKNMVILKLSGLDSIEAVEGFKGCDLLVRRQDAIPLEEGECYVADLIGLPVIDDTGRRLGLLKDVMETGANNVYVVTRDDPEKKELLIPAIPLCILEKNLDEGFIRVHLLEGLEEL